MVRVVLICFSLKYIAARNFEVYLNQYIYNGGLLFLANEHKSKFLYG